jgi:hypothetical protein
MPISRPLAGAIQERIKAVRAAKLSSFQRQRRSEQAREEVASFHGLGRLAQHSLISANAFWRSSGLMVLRSISSPVGKMILSPDTMSSPQGPNNRAFTAKDLALRAGSPSNKRERKLPRFIVVKNCSTIVRLTAYCAPVCFASSNKCTGRGSLCPAVTTRRRSPPISLS